MTDSRAAGVGVELEHAIGFNGGMPNGLHILPANMPVHGSVPDASNPRYIVATGACAVANSMTDPHDQVFFRGHKGPITVMSLSPSGRLLATGESGYDADVVVWDVTTGGVVHRFQEHDHGIGVLGFSGDERLLFVAGTEADGWMHIIDLSTGSILWKHQLEPLPLLAAAFGGFARDVKNRETALYQFATAGTKGLVLWGLHPVSGECSGVRVGRQVPNSLARDYLCMAWTPHSDKGWLYAGTASGDLVVVHVRSRSFYHSTAACGGGLTSLQAIPDYAGSGSARFLPARSQRDYGGAAPATPESVNVLLLAGGGDGSVSVWSHTISAIDQEALLMPPGSGTMLEGAANGKATLAAKTLNLLRTVKLDGGVFSLSILPPLGSAAGGSGGGMGGGGGGAQVQQRTGLAFLAATSHGTVYRVYASDALLGSAASPAGGVGAVAMGVGGLHAAVFRQAHACTGDGFDHGTAAAASLVSKPGAPSVPATVASAITVGAVYDVRFSPGISDKVATCGADNTVRVWDLSDYDCTSVATVRSVGHPRTVVYATDFTVSGWEDGALRVYFADPHNYDAVTHEGAQGLVSTRGYGGPSVGGHGGAGPDPRTLAKEQAGMTTRRAGHEDRGFLWAIPGAHAAAQGGVSALALSHNKRFLVSGGDDARVRLWDMRSREMVVAFSEHSGPITGVCVYKDDAHLITASRDKSIMAWDLRKERRISAHIQRQGGINAVDISRDQSLVLSVGKERRLQLWDLREPSPVQSFGPIHGAQGEGTTVAAAHGMDLVATGGTDGIVRLWDIRGGKPVSECVGHSGSVTKVAWSPDDRQIASVGTDGALMLWNVYA